MIFAVFVLIFRCWSFCFSFDLFKMLVFACFVLFLLVSACLLYFFPLYLHMEEGTTKRGGDKGASPHGAEHRPPWLRSKIFVHIIVWTVINTCTVVAVIINNNANSNTVVTPIRGVYSSCIRIKAINFNALFHVVT